MDRSEIAEGLVAHAEDAADANLPLMIWYGIEPLVAADRNQAVQLMGQCKLPQVREFITRRLTAN